MNKKPKVADQEPSTPPIVDPAMQKKIVEAAMSPSVNAALTMNVLETHKGWDIDLLESSNHLKDAAKEAASGNLESLQQMLATQAQMLDQIFYSFARRSANFDRIDSRERCMRIALKAQSQSRTTVETIAVIQQGPAIFAKNANINHGQQQVNNGVPGSPAQLTPAIEASPPNVLVPDVGDAGLHAATRRRSVRARGNSSLSANQTIGTEGK